jgi:predicted nucleic acid-binding protein
MNVLIDTNVIIDVLLRREPFFDKSKLIITAAEMQLINGFVSASAVTDIFYVVAKSLHDKKVAGEIIKLHLLNALHIAAVDEEIIHAALDTDWDDFEDCVQYNVGESIDADYIITRNVKDFKAGEIAALTPEDFITKVLTA